MIDWDAIKRRGEEGLLTGAETDALVDMAQTVYVGTNFCTFCQRRVAFPSDRHMPFCPIEVLEAINAPD